MYEYLSQVKEGSKALHLKTVFLLFFFLHMRDHHWKWPVLSFIVRGVNIHCMLYSIEPGICSNLVSNTEKYFPNTYQCKIIIFAKWRIISKVKLLACLDLKRKTSRSYCYVILSVFVSILYLLFISNSKQLWWRHERVIWVFNQSCRNRGITYSGH